MSGTWGDEQRKNARILADAGGSTILEQSEATSDQLRRVILELLEDSERRQVMASGAFSVSHRDAVERLTDEVLKLAHERVR